MPARVNGVIVGALRGLGFGALSSTGPKWDWPVMLAVPATLVFVLPSTIQWLLMRGWTAAAAGGSLAW